MNRDQRRAIQQNRGRMILPGSESNLGVPLIYGGQRWKCVNIMCGDMPPNVTRDVPYGVAIKTPAGKDVHLCKKCWDGFIANIVRLIPMLMPFDTESPLSFEDQIAELRQKDADRIEDLKKEIEDKLAEKQTTEDRAAESGLVLAH